MDPLLTLLAGLVIGAALMRWLDWDAAARLAVVRLEHEIVARDIDHRAELEALAQSAHGAPGEGADTAAALEAVILASRILPLSCPLTQPLILALCGAETRERLERFWRIVRNLEAFREDEA
jgi:hypothetical protein